AIMMRHDQAFIAVVLMQPFITIILFGAVLSNEPANVPWAVLDRSRTTVARRLVEDVQATGYFLRPRSVSGYDEGRRLLRSRQALALLVIPDHFARDLGHGRARVQLLLDGSDPLSAARVGGYVTEVAAAFQPPGAPPAIERAPPPRRPGAIDVRQRFRFNP